MTTYATKKDVADIFKKKPRTVQRWLDEGKRIVFDGKEYHPAKDPGGCWRFTVVDLNKKVDVVPEPVKVEPKKTKSQFVYFIQAENGLIKIGTTYDVRKRMGNLYTASPIILNLLLSIPGDTQDEKALHDKFSRDRVKGEWFKASKPLLRYIREMSQSNM